MWRLIGNIKLLPGRRDEMVEILKESAADMPGCLSYVVAKDATDENMIWVTEVWDSMGSHAASLSLPAVRNGIPRGKAIVSNFEKIAVTGRSGELVCQRLTPTNLRTSDEQPGSPTADTTVSQTVALFVEVEPNGFTDRWAGNSVQWDELG